MKLIKLGLSGGLLMAFSLLAQAQQPQQPPASSISSTDPPKPARVKSPPVLPPEKAQPVRVPRFEKPIVVDGKLDEEVWQTAARLKDFYQTRPGDNIPPSHPTEVLLGYDSKTLYIAFRAHDEPGKVRATVAKRDAVFDDDTVQIVLDTFNDRRKAYILLFNPFGVQADGILTEGQGEDFSVDIVMESKGVMTDDGFTVEVAIPFKSLRYVAGKDKLWGLHAFRRTPRLDNEQNSWMPISRDESSFLNQEGHITGLEGISTERTIEIIPTLTLSEGGRRVPSQPFTARIADSGRFVNSPLKTDPGLTLKFGITPTVTLDFAANPDFAQVEADQPVITANQRFPIFFEEKRPFFLEGIDIFQTPLQAVHTRAIIDPDFAVKLSGKQGRNTFGILLASDNAPGRFSEEERNDPSTLPSIEKFIDKNAYVGVLRLKRDIGAESSLGFIGTSYDFIEKHNHLAGFDGRFRLDKQTVLTFQALGTTSRELFFDPDRGDSFYRTGNAIGYSLRFEKQGRHFGYNFDGEGRTRDYRADVGFTRRTNTNREGMFAYYNSEPKPKAKLISWHANQFFGTNFDWQGRMQGWEHGSQLNFSLAHQTFFGIGGSEGYERLFEEEFGPRRTATQAGAFAGGDPERSTYGKGIHVFGGTTPNKKFSAFAVAAYAVGSFDFDFGGGPRFPRVSPAALKNPDAALDPGAGKEFFTEVNITLQPTNGLKASIGYNKDRLVRKDTKRVAFDDNVFSLRATYQFTRFTFVRARMDYDTLGSRVRGQYLFGWTPNPGSAFYVGYNDDLGFNGFSPFTGRLEPGFRRNTRTFFIKTSYLIRRSI